MSEEQAKYEIKKDIDDTIEMLGKGYDAGIEIYPESRVITGTSEGLREYRTGTWIKLSTSFREIMKNLKGSRLAVFLCLCLHIDAENNCFPSHETIADETGYSKREVIEAIKELEEIEFLTVRRGEKRYNFYHVNVAAAMGAETAPVHFVAKNSAVSTKKMSQTALKEEPIKTDKKKIEKQKFSNPLWDIQHGQTPTITEEYKEQEEIILKVEEVASKLEQGLRLNFPRGTKDQVIYRKIANTGKPIERFIEWVKAEQRRLEFAFLYAKDTAALWRDFPQAFPSLVPADSDDPKGSFYG